MDVITDADYEAATNAWIQMTGYNNSTPKGDWLAARFAQHRVDALNEAASVAMAYTPNLTGRAYAVACQSSFEIADAIHALIPGNQP